MTTCAREPGAENDEILLSPLYTDTVREGCRRLLRGRDPPGFDREAFHRRPNAEVVRFFSRELAKS